MRLLRCDWVLLILAAVLVIFGVATWISFPYIYKSAVTANLELVQNNDQTLSKAAWLWSHPPMMNVMSFYFFNVTNPDEIIYEGAKPMLAEVGPWAVQEKEEKKYLKWSPDHSQVFYENYKQYLVRPELCNGCSLKDKVTIPNSPGLGAAADIFDPQYGVTETGRKIVAFGLLILGEYPFVTQTVGDILFNGYDDALLDIAHSKWMTLINNVFNNGKPIIPIPIPEMPRMGFFQGYNNTQDEWYWVTTGKTDINTMGSVVTWGNRSSLPEDWWTDDYARSIRGTDSGTFSKMNLQKSDTIPMFQSFMCRSFDATYLEDVTISSIPSLTFSVPYEQYDTTADQNVGFRYRNVEQVNYYPDWPSCPNRNATNCIDPDAVDCGKQANLCDDCCDGSFYNGTYLLPPGLFPLVCYPGRLQPTPFSVMYSPPHFAYSPREVVDSVVGLNPDINKHRPMMYSHEPYSGEVTKVVFQLMVSMPVRPNTVVPQCMHMPSSIIPLFWQSAKANLHDDTYNLIWLGFVFVPRFVDVLKYTTIILGLFLVMLVAFRVFRRR